MPLGGAAIGPAKDATNAPTGGPGPPLTTGRGSASCWKTKFVRNQKFIYQRPRERGPIYAQRKQAGQHPREAPAAAIGGDAGRVPARSMRCGRLVPRLAPTVPGGVRGARWRGGMPTACVNRRPMDGQQRPRWPRAAGMFQPGIMKTKFFC